MNRSTEVTDSTHETILNAADRLLQRYGFRKVTMDDIAQEAHLVRRTLYLHFHSKEEIALAVLDRGIRALIQQTHEIASQELTPSKRLQVVLLTRVRLVHEFVQRRSFSYAEIIETLRPEYMERREQYFLWEAEAMVSILREGKAKGELFFDDPLETALCLLLGTNAFMPFSLNERQMADYPKLESQLKRIIHLLLKGLSINTTTL